MTINNAALEARLKTLTGLFDQPEAMLEVMFTSVNPRETKNNLFNLFGPSAPTLMPATIMDIMAIKQMDDDDYNPSQFVCGGCDPAIPLLINEVQMGWMSSHSALYQKRVWSSSYCSDEDFTKSMLSELPNMPWGGRKFTQREKEALMTAKAGRQMFGEMRASWIRMWTDDFLWAAQAINGPGIPKDTVLDMNRNPKLWAQLEGDGWCNPNADRSETLRAFADHVYEQSGEAQSFPNVFIFDKIAKKKFFEGVEFQECDPCGGHRNPYVSRPGVRLEIDRVRADEMRGMRRINYSDDSLPGAEFWCLDEDRTKCLDEDGNKVKESILPAGYILAFNSATHAPIGLHGRIQTRQVDAPMQVYSRTFDCGDGCDEDGKFGIKMDSSPLYFNKRENTIGGLYVAPTECAPRTKGVSKNACDPMVLACDPEGGKKIVAQARLAEARSAQAIAEATVKLQNTRNTADKVVESEQKLQSKAAPKLGDKK